MKTDKSAKPEGSAEEPRTRDEAARELRRQAERTLGESAAAELSQFSSHEADELVHELRVHQIELEMQNDELRCTTAELEALRERYFNHYDIAPVGYLSLDAEGRAIEGNLLATSMLGLSRSDLSGSLLSQFIVPEDQDLYYLERKRLLDDGSPRDFELRLRGKDGPHWVLATLAIASEAPRGGAHSRCTLQAIDRLKEGEEALRASNEALRRAERRLRVRSRVTELFLSVRDDELYGALLREVLEVMDSSDGFFGYLDGRGDMIVPSSTGRRGSALKALPSRGTIIPRAEFATSCWGRALLDGRLRCCEGADCELSAATEGPHVSLPLVIGERVIGIFHVTRRDRPYEPELLNLLESMGHGAAAVLDARFRRDEMIRERERLSDQFHQAQKMETVALLASGVAHDNNNMLSVILGYVEMALETMDPAEPLYGDLQEIYATARRSAKVTRQLMTFSRHQIVSPVVLDLNLTVENTFSMLHRYLGEDVKLEWKPAPELWPVRMDPCQVDQILSNLCINARDAIDGAGTISIETENVRLEKEDCADREMWRPGDFVRLTVSDDGSGIPPDLLSRIFEPFFTTKGSDRGTGLGLPTVHGIVGQCRGFIEMHGLPKGSAFAIYLPREESSSPVVLSSARGPVPRGDGELLLIVDDDPAISNMTRRMLERLGYRVLSATTPREALRKVRDDRKQIRLLLTDVVMPEMNGKELADEVLGICPTIDVIFMSGYPASVIDQRGILDPGVHFVHKPFDMRGLATKIDSVLHPLK